MKNYKVYNHRVNFEIAFDITERKISEENLKDSILHLDIAQKIANIGSYNINFEDGSLDWSNHLYRIFGYEPGEVVPTFDLFKSHVHPDYKNMFVKKAKIDLIGHQPYVNEYLIIRKDGDVRTVYSTERVEKDEKGTPKRILGTLQDITEHNRAVEDLRKSEEHLRLLVDGAKEYAIFMLDPEGRVVTWNKGAERIKGYKKEEIIGRHFSIFYEQKDIDSGKPAEDLKMAAADGSFEEEGWRIRKDGTNFCASVFITALENKDGSLQGFSKITRDITERKKNEQERKKLENQLLQSQKMEAIGTLTGGIAHDFNNLLTTIIGYSELALDDLIKDTPLYDTIKEIMKAGRRAGLLTRQLLAFSRKQVIQPEILNINDILTVTEKMLRRTIGEDIDMVSVFAPELWNVEMDPGQMEQVLMNLAINARDAMPKGGKLTIETANVELDEAYFRDHSVESNPGPHVMLAVTDSGTGMDEQTRSRIFEPFFTTKEMERGTGLGLSTVYGIVKQNKGHISVYSEPGEGTTFKVYLPAVMQDIEGAKEEDKAFVDQLGGTETVLLVEDDDMLCRMAQKILETHGYTVLSAHNSDEALKIANYHHDSIHLLLTDLVIPGMNGKELAGRIESILPGIKVLYMSGYTDNAIAHHGVLDRDINFIQKPFSPNDLVQKVREVLDRDIEDWKAQNSEPSAHLKY
ncbi:MAG: PAS domain S-box protein [Deltaproteobacteria bacterium]|nr:PAS domain S-box protein [Deltaproteobacteria bacterium]